MQKFNSNLYFLVSLILSQFILIKSNSIFDYSHVQGEPLNILAGSLSSSRGVIPYGYNELKICQSKKIIRAEDTLGEILTGESYYTTGYIAKTNENQFCNVLCYNPFTAKNVKIYKKLIKRYYFSSWVVDKLPAGRIEYNLDSQETKLSYFNAIPLGYKKDNNFYIYNHLQFHILLNKIDEDRYNVVGFNILPMSIKHDNDKAICEKSEKQILLNFKKPPQPLEEGNILFTYDVVYEYSDITFASRWDHYRISKKNIHFTGIIISEILVLGTTLIVVRLFRKTVRNDIDSYNYRVSQFEDIPEYDWKQIFGDVFRPPQINTGLLSALLGTGVQLLCMFSMILFLGVMGFMKPEKRANILNMGILFYCFCGLIAGFISSYFYRFFGGESWLRVSIYTSTLFPGTLVFGYIIINIILTIEKSNAAVNFSDILALFFLWIFCTFPLILIGSFSDLKAKKWRSPALFIKSQA